MVLFAIFERIGIEYRSITGFGNGWQAAGQGCGSQSLRVQEPKHDDTSKKGLASYVGKHIIVAPLSLPPFLRVCCILLLIFFASS